MARFVVLLLFVVYLTAGGETGSSVESPLSQDEETACNFVDVIFVVDGSGSVGRENFAIVKEWIVTAIENILSYFGSKAQIGVVEFSYADHAVPVADATTFEIPFQLGDCSDFECYRDGVMNMAYLGYTTHSYYALLRAMEVEFPISKRKDSARKIIIFLTDGRATDGEQLDNWYGESTAAGIITCAIGVEPANIEELRLIANGNSGYDRVYSVAEFAVIPNITDLMKDTCGDSLSDPPTTTAVSETTQPNCDCKIQTSCSAELQELIRNQKDDMALWQESLRQHMHKLEEFCSLP